jgi:hypothetical protein
MRPTVRTSTYPPRYPAPMPKKRSKRWLWLVVVVAVLVIAPAALRSGITHTTSTIRKVSGIDVAPNSYAIRSGYSGACLDVFHSGAIDGTPIDASSCNDTAAQDWTTTATTIQHKDSNACVTANTNGSIVLSSCSNTASQVWLRDQEGYYNPNTGNCLSASGKGTQLRLASCGLSSASEDWTPATKAQEPPCGGSQGEAIACNAVKQWTAWQANGSNHEALLTTYTDGTPYEEWCADFISYVYQQAGYPFTNGSADGWDENDANSIQFMGFNMHQAGSGYQPKPGDVAFFDYPGGHVEIVVSGGSKPTFVYGDSAQIDPTTGNGQMKANTITHDVVDGTSGQLVYYLSPAVS